jgi:PLP dependent protein
MLESFGSNSIADRIGQIRETLPASVRLIAVTKQVSVDAMREAYGAGIRDFGESKIQEAAAKQQQLADLPDLTWHLIGHLQSNKAVLALEQFEWIHSVDSLKLAQRLSQLAANLENKPNVCLQVKLLPDPSKYGWTVLPPDPSTSELWSELPLIDQCSNLNIAGLMTIPPYGLAPEQTRSVFLQTRELAQQIQQQSWTNICIDQLSMGMSEDYPLAIQAGATMIRLGRILFGERS